LYLTPYLRFFPLECGHDWVPSAFRGGGGIHSTMRISRSGKVQSNDGYSSGRILKESSYDAARLEREYSTNRDKATDFDFGNGP